MRVITVVELGGRNKLMRFRGSIRDRGCAKRVVMAPHFIAKFAQGLLAHREGTVEQEGASNRASRRSAADRVPERDFRPEVRGQLGHHMGNGVVFADGLVDRPNQFVRSADHISMPPARLNRRPQSRSRREGTVRMLPIEH